MQPKERHDGDQKDLFRASVHSQNLIHLRRPIGGRFASSTRPGNTRADRSRDEPARRVGTFGEFCSEMRRV
jgi:hypothetical protein